MDSVFLENFIYACFIMTFDTFYCDEVASGLMLFVWNCNDVLTNNVSFLRIFCLNYGTEACEFIKGC